MRNRLGFILVLAYFAHSIMSVAYAATFTDPKSQAVWLSAPLWLTPTWFYGLLPTVQSSSACASWHIQTLVRFPIAFTFSSVLLFVVGALLQRLWVKCLWLAVAVGFIIGLSFGGLWFLVTHARNPLWFALGPAGALASAFVFKKQVPPSLLKPPLTIKAIAIVR